MSKYAWALLFSGIIPFILSFYPPLKFYRNIKGLIVSILVVLLFFGAWDVGAAMRGHWWFSAQGVCAVRIINLPFEEWLFFIVIPFCAIFTWEAILYIKDKR